MHIVRALDILGAKRRSKEYEALLYRRFSGTHESAEELRKEYKDKLPVRFLDRLSNRKPTSTQIGIVGPRRLIEYFIIDQNFIRYQMIR